MPDDFHYDVFLNHSSKDKTAVLPLVERLRADGLQTVSQPSTLNSQPPGGSDWAQLEAGTFRFRDPLNHEPRLAPLRLEVSLSTRFDNAAIKDRPAQFCTRDNRWRPSLEKHEYPTV